MNLPCSKSEFSENRGSDLLTIVEVVAELHFSRIDLKLGECVIWSNLTVASRSFADPAQKPLHNLVPAHKKILIFANLLKNGISTVF